MGKTRNQAVFGDFQTPLDLARSVVALIEREESEIGTVVEPTCGLGSFLQAAAELIGNRASYFGFDINPEYVEVARSALRKMQMAKGDVAWKDFYQMDWREFFCQQPAPLLVVGNPPWITSAAMGAIGGRNLPEKTNFQRHTGFAAKTGKANFDISEWMLIKLIESLQGIPATLGMLCKTATARKILRHAWLNGLDVGPSSLHRIDASAHFGVSVDACLLYTHTGGTDIESTATIYPDLSFKGPQQTIGLFGGELVSDVDSYLALRDLAGLEYRKWRSGVKHDAAKVMQLRREHGVFVNGLGERYELESDYLYPLLKSSDLANGRLRPTRYVLLTQQRVTDQTDSLREAAPKIWQYLLDHGEQLDKRSSSIYRNRARFSVFGIGDYTFSPAKVAISGFYKNLRFRAVGTCDGKPIVVDDTCYFIPCQSKREAQFFAALLNSEMAQRFILSLVFMDAKRPITIDILRRIDLQKLAEHVGEEATAAEYLASPALESSRQRLLVFAQRERHGTRASG